MPAKFDSDKVDLKGLDQLAKALKIKAPHIKIGILGSESRSVKKGEKHSNNATIGAVHEFGAPARNIPQRSFLRIPLTMNLTKELDKSGLLKKESFQKVIQSGSLLSWVDQVAVVALGVVDDAFDQQGPGWAAWKDPNYHNEGGSILHDTGQLRNSITTEIVK